MGAQGLRCCIVASELCLGQRGVDFLVANVVEQNRFTALPAPQTRNQVVAALRHARRDSPVAQWTDGRRIVHEA